MNAAHLEKFPNPRKGRLNKRFGFPGVRKTHWPRCKNRPASGRRSGRRPGLPRPPHPGRAAPPGHRGELCPPVLVGVVALVVREGPLHRLSAEDENPAVRGLHGEGTEALGNVFQVSNQMTLGETESDIVERLNKVLLQIIDHEENARGKLLENKAKMVYNHIGRAYGILANSHSISSKETMNLLSLFRLGIDLSLFPGNKPALTEELFIITQPAHLQKTRAGKLSAEKRDILRANLLRSRLLKVDRPATPDTGKTEENGE